MTCLPLPALRRMLSRCVLLFATFALLLAASGAIAGAAQAKSAGHRARKNKEHNKRQKRKALRADELGGTGVAGEIAAEAGGESGEELPGMSNRAR